MNGETLENTLFQDPAGPYHDIRKGIELRDTPIMGKGLFATELIPKGSIVWYNHLNFELHGDILAIGQIKNLAPENKAIVIKYGYQIDNDRFATPITQEDIDEDYSNYWNHSCDPNCVPVDVNTWVAWKDIHPNEQVTIDYCTFDCNLYECIPKCLCGTKYCRGKITNQDFMRSDVQERYKGHFLPYIQEKIDNLFK